MSLLNQIIENLEEAGGWDARLSREVLHTIRRELEAQVADLSRQLGRAHACCRAKEGELTRVKQRLLEIRDEVLEEAADAVSDHDCAYIWQCEANDFAAKIRALKSQPASG